MNDGNMDNEGAENPAVRYVKPGDPGASEALERVFQKHGELFSNLAGKCVEKRVQAANFEEAKRYVFENYGSMLKRLADYDGGVEKTPPIQ